MMKCSVCGMELPDEQFSNKQGVRMYRRCKKCRSTLVKRCMARHASMPWYEDWILKDRPFVANRYEKYEKPKKYGNNNA